MKTLRNMSTFQFFLLLFAVATVVTICTARYYGRPSYPQAVLLAFFVSVGATMTSEGILALVRKWYGSKE